VSESLFQDFPENKDAPCNICGRGWPYHHDSCAYAQTAKENLQLKAALRQVLSWPLPKGTVETYSLPGWLAKLAHDALGDEPEARPHG
jgi:hypothetical protein